MSENQEIRKVRLREVIDAKPTDRTSISKKDQNGHGTVKFEKFKNVLYTFTVFLRQSLIRMFFQWILAQIVCA